jgi:hypothetical protein
MGTIGDRAQIAGKKKLPKLAAETSRTRDVLTPA